MADLSAVRKPFWQILEQRTLSGERTNMLNSLFLESNACSRPSPRCHGDFCKCSQIPIHGVMGTPTETIHLQSGKSLAIPLVLNTK